MTYVTDADYPRRQNWLRRTEAWFDSKVKLAWIALMVVSFVVFWPVGLALLAYLIWSKRLSNGSCAARTRNVRHAFSSSGNTAFDAYKEATLRRLEDEQDAFEAFLQRLREAKDKAEFDEFVDAREKQTRDVKDEAAEA